MHVPAYLAILLETPAELVLYVDEKKTYNFIFLLTQPDTELKHNTTQNIQDVFRYKCLEKSDIKKKLIFLCLKFIKEKKNIKIFDYMPLGPYLY